MKHIHFLGNINDDSWLGNVRSFILLSFGPESRAHIQQHLQTLRALPGVKSLDLNAEDLHDFTVRQVDMDELLNSDELEDLYEIVREHDNPLPVPEQLLKNVLLQTSEYDDLTVRRLPIFHQGTLEMSVCLPVKFDGREFQVDGAINLLKLVQDFPAAGAG